MLMYLLWYAWVENRIPKYFYLQEHTVQRKSSIWITFDNKEILVKEYGTPLQQKQSNF